MAKKPNILRKARNDMTYELIETYNSNGSHKETFEAKDMKQAQKIVNAMYPGIDLDWFYSAPFTLPLKDLSWLEAEFDVKSIDNPTRDPAIGAMSPGEYTVTIERK